MGEGGLRYGNKRLPIWNEAPKFPAFLGNVTFFHHWAMTALDFN